MLNVNVNAHCGVARALLSFVLTYAKHTSIYPRAYIPSKYVAHCTLRRMESDVLVLRARSCTLFALEPPFAAFVRKTFMKTKRRRKTKQAHKNTKNPWNKYVWNIQCVRGTIKFNISAILIALEVNFVEKVKKKLQKQRFMSVSAILIAEKVEKFVKTL